MPSLKKLITHYITIFSIIILLLLGGVIWLGNYLAHQGDATDTVTQSEKKVALIAVRDYARNKDEILTSGTVESLDSVEMKGQTNAPVTAVNVKIGDTVQKGQVLVTLQNADLQAQYAQVLANVRAQRANLAQLKAGTRPEQLKITQTELDRANQNLENTYTSTRDLLNDAFSKSDDAVRTKTADLFINADTDTPVLSFQVKDSQVGIDIVSLRLRAGKELLLWRDELQNISGNASHADIEKALVTAQNHIVVVRSLLTRSIDAVNVATNLSASQASGYKSNIFLAQTNINAVRSGLTAQTQALASQKTNVAQTQNQLLLQQAGATNEQIEAQQAIVEQTEAGTRTIAAQIDKTIIRAPIGGKISALPVKIGDLVTLGQPIVSIVNANGLKVRAYISAEDLTRVSEGAKVFAKNGATSTEGVLTQLSPSVNPITKKVEIVVVLPETASAQFVAGQYADLSIVPNQGASAGKIMFLLPLQSVKIRNDGAFVFFVNNGSVEERKIEVGNVSGEAIEVVSGVSEDDKVISIASDVSAGEKVIVQ